MNTTYVVLYRGELAGLLQSQQERTAVDATACQMLETEMLKTGQGEIDFDEVKVEYLQ